MKKTSTNPPDAASSDEAARDRLRRLLSEACDANLDGESGSAGNRERLDEIASLLEQNRELTPEYVAYLTTESVIEQSCGLTFLDEDGAGVASFTPPASTTAPSSRATKHAPVANRKSWLHRIAAHPLWAVAAMTLIAATAGLAWLAKPALSTVVAASEARLIDGSELRVGQHLGDDWFELRRGSVRLALRDGAMASVEAPAKFRVQQSNAAELGHGAVRVQVPESAHGFRLSNRHGTIIDLGTGFRAIALEGGPLSVHVTQGAVRVEPTSGGSLELQAGQLAEVRPDGGAEILSANRHKPAVSGQFRYVEEHPESLGYNAYVHDDEAFVFLESHAVTLPHDLRLDLAATPGSHTSFLGSMNVIPKGTVIDCYLIHCAPARPRHEVKGSVRFRGAILGVLCNDDRLNATNDLLGASWTLACQHPERGIESIPDPNSDLLKISPDRRKLSGHFRTMSIDQVRVLVARDR